MGPSAKFRNPEIPEEVFFGLVIDLTEGRAIFRTTLPRTGLVVQELAFFLSLGVSTWGAVSPSSQRSGVWDLSGEGGKAQTWELCFWMGTAGGWVPALASTPLRITLTVFPLRSQEGSTSPGRWKKNGSCPFPSWSQKWDPCSGESDINASVGIRGTVRNLSEEWTQSLSKHPLNDPLSVPLPQFWFSPPCTRRLCQSRLTAVTMDVGVVGTRWRAFSDCKERSVCLYRRRYKLSMKSGNNLYKPDQGSKFGSETKTAKFLLTQLMPLFPLTSMQPIMSFCPIQV